MARLRSVVPVLALAASFVAGASARAEAAASAPVALAAPRVAGPRMVLPFLHDDWSRAMQRARERRLPVFVEAWAPW